MNTRSLLFPTLVFFFFFPMFINSSLAQTVAVGHIYAEVVESVSASCSLNSGIYLNNSESGTNARNRVARDSRIALGSVMINQGVDVACSLTVQSTRLTDAMGNGFVLEPNTTHFLNSGIIQGSQTIELEAVAMIDGQQASGFYQGDYTLVLAYN